MGNLNTRVLQEQDKSPHDSLARKTNPAIETALAACTKVEHPMHFLNHVNILHPEAEQRMDILVSINGVVKFSFGHPHASVFIDCSKREFERDMDNTELGREELAIMHLDVAHERLMNPDTSKQKAVEIIQQAVASALSGRGIGVERDEIQVLGIEVE